MSPAGLNAGRIYATLGGHYDAEAFQRWDASMKRSGRQADQFERNFVQAQQRTTKAARMAAAGIATAAGVGILAFAKGISTSISKATEFDAAMRNVNSIAKVSERQFDALGKKVLAMAGRTGQAPKVLAEALYDLVSSGFDANEALLVLEASANAATAGLTDAATSTKAVAAVLNAYKLPASEAARVSDVLFQTVNAGVLTFEELAQNIGDVLPFAASLGSPLEEIGAAIATITKNGVPAAQAFTQVKAIFSQLLSPSDGLAKAIDRTGASSAEALVKQKGLQGALRALQGTTDGSKASMAQLFPNVEALASALALTGRNARGAERDLAALTDSKGATQKALSEQEKSFENAKKKFNAALDAGFITVGQELLPELTEQLPKIADAISSAIENGDLERFGKQVGEVLGDILEHAPDVVDSVDAIATAVGTIADAWETLSKFPPLALMLGGPKAGLDAFLGIATTVMDVFTEIAKAVSEVPDPLGVLPDMDDQIRGFSEAADRINQIREELRGDRAPAKIIVEGEGVKKALVDLDRLGKVKLPKKALEVIGSTAPAEKQIEALKRLPLPPRIARVLASTDSAESKLAQVRRLLEQLRDKTVTVTTVELRREASSAPPRVGGVGRTPRAAGRGAIGAERALIGEDGPEYRIDANTGRGYKTSGPELADLGPSDYVVPTTDRYRPGAMGLFMALARDLGIRAFGKGKKGKGKGKAPKYDVPARIAEGGVPFDDVEDRYQKAKDRNQKAARELSQARKREKDTAERLRRIPKGKSHDRERSNARLAHDKAERALRDAERHRARTEKTEKRSHADYKAAKALSDQVAELRSGINVLRDEMELAARAGDGKTFNARKATRAGKLDELSKLLKRARGRGAAGAHLRDLNEQISQLDLDIGSNADEQLDAPDVEAPETTPPQLEADLALARLTETLDDDRRVLEQIEDFQAGLLTQLQGGGAPPEHITAAAQALKNTRDDLKSLAQGPSGGPDADLQAQLDQERARRENAERDRDVNAAALSVLGQSGDLGVGGGGRVVPLRGGTVINVNTLHPGDPRTLDAIGRAATGGQALQGSRRATRERVF